MLKCNKKGVSSGYPLQIVVATDPTTGNVLEGAVQTSESEFNVEFIVRMIPKLEWGVFVNAARQMGCDGAQTLPSQFTQDLNTNEQFLRVVHHCLLEVRLVEGFLVCPESQRKFPVNNSIPNMLLREDEV
jgi:multifunctional methyltransferase subunit TRM112|tara:strand:- start:555 stop:944 length:390 start_codon:yes stop_codon:yes gene_type:complete